MEEKCPEASTWFAVLRVARAAGDRVLERMARQQLEVLGYRVVFQRPKPEPRARQETTQ